MTNYTPVLYIFLGCVLLAPTIILLSLGFGTNWTTLAEALVIYTFLLAFFGVVLFVVMEWVRR